MFRLNKQPSSRNKEVNMCVNKIKQAARKAAKFLVDNTSIDYVIAKKSVEYGFKLFKNFDYKEKIEYIKYLKTVITNCKTSISTRDAFRLGGKYE